MSIRVEKITDKETFAQAVQIRKAVFVLEQKVDPNDEYDQFEETSHHFLAKLDGKPAGAARWRRTEKG
ncbi:MAG: GNAT family N-acetyltransferase, partial [Algoriphagus sp. 32-45-6]